jgi:hypothetical protein
MPRRLVPSINPMTPSRVADAMFWLGRYVERADGLTRLVREVLAGAIDTRTERQQAALWLLGSQFQTETLNFENACRRDPSTGIHADCRRRVE